MAALLSQCRWSVSAPAGVAGARRQPSRCSPPFTRVHRRSRVLASSEEPSTRDQPPAGPASSAPSPPPVEQPSNRNGLLAGGAAGFGVALFLATRVLGGGPSFAALEAAAVPIDTALANGLPTLVEFYADYCEVCRELLPQTLSAEEQFKGRINFVALNVENTKWTPEVLEYGVSGIPHFVFLDAQGRAQAAAVGKLPPEVLLGNLEALAENAPLPFSRMRGETSPMQRPEGVMAGPGKQAGPRDHF